MEQYLQQIQREISEKAPLIEQQRFAYNKLISLNTSLADKTQALQQEATFLRLEYEKLVVQRAEESAQLVRSKQESDDLARQVRSLLRGKSQVSHTYKQQCADMSSRPVGANALLCICCR